MITNQISLLAQSGLPEVLLTHAGRFLHRHGHHRLADAAEATAPNISPTLETVAQILEWLGM